MSAPATLSERFVESVGPIVVKEVRQGLRAKVFALFFGSLLVVCLSMALVAVAGLRVRISLVTENKMLTRSSATNSLRFNNNANISWVRSSI